MAHYRVPVPTRDCVGMDVSEGGRTVARYDAHNGYVETDNASHARALRRMSGSPSLLGMSHAQGEKAAESGPCSCDCGCTREVFKCFGHKCWRCRHDGCQVQAP